MRAEIIKGDWTPPEAGEVELGDYGARWISERKLAPRTREGYEDLFRLHVRPHLGSLMLNAVKPRPSERGGSGCLPRARQNRRRRRRTACSGRSSTRP
ncbi:MAG: hypothetical protein ACRDTM_10095 [Micromonosporaceae bacterium]